jgi:hypothetical protein
LLSFDYHETLVLLDRLFILIFVYAAATPSDGLIAENVAKCEVV